jgi:hypothetical protein
MLNLGQRQPVGCHRNRACREPQSGDPRRGSPHSTLPSFILGRPFSWAMQWSCKKPFCGKSSIFHKIIFLSPKIILPIEAALFTQPRHRTGLRCGLQAVHHADAHLPPPTPQTCQRQSSGSCRSDGCALSALDLRT